MEKAPPKSESATQGHGSLEWSRPWPSCDIVAGEEGEGGGRGVEGEYGQSLSSGLSLPVRSAMIEELRSLCRDDISSVENCLR